MFETYKGFFDTLKRQQFSQKVGVIKNQILNKVLDGQFSRLVRPYFLNKIMPFDDFYSEPASVSQIKKLLNALYHLEIALTDMESVNIRDSHRRLIDLKTLYRHATPHLYKAAFLITHPEVDVFSIFHQEIALLLPLFKSFYDHVTTHVTQTGRFFKSFEASSLPGRVGFYSGVVIDQLKPKGSQMDFEFITQFSATLPEYLNQITCHIRQYVTNAPLYKTIDPTVLNTLQREGISLLDAIEQLQTNQHVLLLFHIPDYMRIVRHISKLTTSILDEATHMNDASQQLIRLYLTDLKIKWLPAFLSVIDKFEAELMLKPGILSNYCMKQCRLMYGWLVHYLKKMVNLSQNSEHLKTIDDTQFKEARARQTYQRLSDIQMKTVKLEQVNRAFDLFFEILQRPQYQTQRLSELPKEINSDLQNHYKLIKPYMAVLDVSVSNTIVRALTTERGIREWVLGWTGRYADGIESLLQLKPQLKLMLQKQENTLRFQRDMHSDLIQFITGHAPGIENLQVEPVVIDPEPLTLEMTEERAHFVIKHPEYLRTISEFRQSFQELINLFNPAIQAELIAASEGLPFPELAGKDACSSQSSQVVLLKRVFNILYYLESICFKLNQLNDQSFELTYVSQVFNAGVNAHQCIKHVMAIYSDPYFAPMTHMVWDKIRAIYHAMRSWTQPYIEMETVTKELYASSKILYPLNAMLILPEHIEALKQGKDFDAVKMQTIHEHAICVSNDIQRIIDSANAYFRLFLEAPTIYRLLHHLKKKLLSMANATHESVLEHLEEIRHTLLPQLLLEADAWEDKLGFKPGLFSSDLNMILERLFQGLLEPLDLPSTRHVALATSLTSFDKRIEAVQQRIDEAPGNSVNRSTARLVQKIAEEKITYLTQQKQTQDSLNEQWRETYALKTFERLVASLHTETFGLIYNRQAYTNALVESLHTDKVQMLDITRDCEAIDDKLRQLLNQKITLFTNKYYTHYHQLDAVLSAFERFKHYARDAMRAIEQQTSGFESQDTLTHKLKTIERLEQIATQNEVNPEARLQKLCETISSLEFKRTMCQYHHYEPVSFAWFKQCIIALLDAAGLYTPSYKKQHRQLLDASNKPKEVGIADTSWGLFAASERTYSLPQSIIPQPAPLA